MRKTPNRKHTSRCNSLIKTVALLTVFFIANVSTAQIKTDVLNVERQLDYCASQVLRALDGMKNDDGSYKTGLHPRKIQPSWGSEKWACYPATPKEWTSGFWPGILWMAYDASHNEEIRRAAEAYSDTLKGIVDMRVADHDIGFLVYSPLIKALTITGDNKYKRIMLAAADSLATLFNPKVGTICSWPQASKPHGWPHNTIIDNMMNLELLFWAADNGGSSHLRDIAIKHAKTTARNHFHDGFTAYHLAVYDTISGQFSYGRTVQGYHNNSMWSRGQAWAIYGYTMTYRYTRDPYFLKVAKGCADAYLKRLPENDYIPYWDFDAPRPTARDASAACIVADALIELSNYTSKKKGARYRQKAISMLSQLSTPEYLSGKEFVSFLKHSTGHFTANSEVDVSIVYADYYYIEALLRLRDAAISPSANK